MASISISAYTVRVQDVRDTEFKDVSDFDETGADLYHTCIHYFDLARRNQVNNEDTKKIARLHEYEVIEPRQIKGVINTGEYGYTSDIIHVDSGNVNYQKSTLEASVIPFYFRIWIPENRDEGVLLLQNFKQSGITNAMRDLLLRPFKRDFRNYKIVINPLVPRSAVLGFLEHHPIVKARFIRFGLPADQARAIGHPHQEQNITVEYSMTAKEHSQVPIKERVRNVINGDTAISSIMEWEDFTYDDVRVEVEVNGRPKTISLLDITKMRPRFDISENVQYGLDGHPIIDSVDEEAEILLTHLANAIGLADDLES